jgi:hypothetical protein
LVGKTKVSRNGSLLEDSFRSADVVGLLDLLYLCPFFRTETTDINREICKKIYSFQLNYSLDSTFLLKEIVEEKVNHLEDENKQLKEIVTQLKTKIGQQDSILTDLLKNRHQQDKESLKLLSKNVLLENPTSGKSAAMPRTCRETRLSNPALASGMYWIDPDGQGVGDDPISVYCDMNSGKTFHYLINDYYCNNTRLNCTGF